MDADTICREAILTLDQANDAIYAIKSCRTESELVQVTRRLVHYFGLEWFVFVTLRRGDETNESYRYLIGCMPAWCQLYNARKWYACDPFVEYALRHSSPILGSAVKPEGEGQRELLRAAAEHGFRSGMVVPAHGGYKSRIGVLYLGSEKAREDVEPGLLRHRNLLRALSLELLEWWQAKIQAEAAAMLKLDDLDVDLLRKAHESATAEQAAQELGITVSRANGRYQQISMKLQAPNKRSAVERAIHLGVLAV